MSERPKEIERLRKAMGTLPATQPLREDNIYVGVSHLKVELVDYPRNPYRSIYEMVTSTWGSREGWWKRWEEATPEGRLQVVLAALQGKTLQQALEAPSFTFRIQGLSRGSFDQLCRHRFTGVGSVGSRDNNHLDAALIIPEATKEMKGLIEEWWVRTKDLYETMIQEGQQTWQNARFILPMGMEWRFTWAMNLRSLQEICAQRMVFCEQFDTVATVWKMRDVLEKKFPLLAAFLRPRCDWAGRCTYSEAYSLSELFGCLFKPCGRWPIEKKDYEYATFNESSTSQNEIEQQLKIKIPSYKEWDEDVEFRIKKDMHHFEEE